MRDVLSNGDVPGDDIGLQLVQGIRVAYFLFAQHPPEAGNQDYVECTEWLGVNPAGGAPQEFVALEPLLRRTPYDGNTFGGITYTYTDNFTRTANPGGIVEVITPPFEIGEILMAVRVGTTFAIRQNPTSGSQRVQWQMFGSGRVWSSETVTGAGLGP